MVPLVRSLTCSRCGAPLPAGQHGPFLLCVYCNTAHRLASDPTTALPHVESSAIAEHDVARISHLIGLGRRQEAIAAYLAAARCARAEAEAAVAAWEFFRGDPSSILFAGKAPEG